MDARKAALLTSTWNGLIDGCLGRGRSRGFSDHRMAAVDMRKAALFGAAFPLSAEHGLAQKSGTPAAEAMLFDCAMTGA